MPTAVRGWPPTWRGSNFPSGGRRIDRDRRWLRRQAANHLSKARDPITAKKMRYKNRVSAKKRATTTNDLPWCITLDNSKGISRLRFWAKNHRVNGINDLPVFMHHRPDPAVF